MHNLKLLLPISNSLLVFTVAARIGNFTKTGQELGMTQASVSYFIKQLEQYLGVPLFHRQHRKVLLTDEGERLFQEVSTGFTFVQRGIEFIKQRASENHVTISSSTAFASYWLLPRMMAFRRTHPEIDLRLQTSDKDVNLIDESISLGIRHGEGDWSEYDCAELAREQIFAVAKNDYFNTRDRPQKLEDLMKHRLIHLDEPFRPRTSWKDWFAANRVDFYDKGEGLRLNDYALVIQATLEGQGIAFGWQHIVDRLIDAGLLIKVVPDSFDTGKAFYLVWPKEKSLSPEAIKVRDWIVKQIR